MAAPADLAPADAARVVAGAAEAAARFAADVAALDDDAMHGPSALPGWTRSMVCAHVAHVGSAMARLTRDALAGRTGSAMYPDGRAEREATIKAGRRRSAGELRARLARAQEELDAVWPGLPPEAWATVRRDPELGPMLLTRLAVGRWTELEVHRTDLDVPGADPSWSPTYVATALPLRVSWLGPHQRRGSTVDGEWTIAAVDLDRAWRVTAHGDDVRVEEAPVDPHADIRGPAAAVLAHVLGRDVGPPAIVSAAGARLREAFGGP